MNKFIAMTAAFLIGSAVLEAHAGEEEDTSPHEYCSTLSSLAGTVMEKRQGGASLSQVMDVATMEIVREMAIMAYGQPAFSTPRYQAEAIVEFSNQWYLGCIKANQ